ncbi:ABC transporter substrate-binding protein [Rhodovastum atsumiense]|uniref:ABC transporter substrate-binding protein n=1 Tax=Rhodovastum atsumiense TaxID=504468 RepID=A0A5M6J200_9PROT|nr:ABC transporter substrate-binding protein [Rhodovastum atsumiense]KAA5614561.1 ABC transporter substrate-binding protein [Rhodovastum atsumiense]CAH2599947.1 ABC transporter substrate-binding protein [Rhodovastum atsumiense]
MLTRRSVLAASAATAFVPSAFAATPKDVLVVGQQLEQLISLDPGETFEVNGGEAVSNCYNRLLEPDPADPNRLKGDLAETWEVAPDGVTFTFHLRGNAKFATGKPVTAEDAAFSLQRAVKLNKTPAFILTQFGFARDNVDVRIVAPDPRTLVLTVGAQVAPTLLLYCLTANVASVVEKAEVLANAQGDDLGNQWLKTHSAGSGPYVLRNWKANETVLYETNPHALVRPKTRRVIVKHIADPSAQLLQLQKGDIDIARDLQAEQLRAAEADPSLRLSRALRGSLLYVGMNQAHPALARPEVRQAIKWAIDYDAIQKNITPFTHRVHQSFLPEGFPASIKDQPFRRDLARARDLLARAGFAQGFEVTLDHASIQPTADIAQAIQANLGELGIKVTLVAGESRQVFTRTRARQHQLALLAWGPDYFDPHTNAEAFNINTDNSDTARSRTLAWRNSWQDTELSERAAAAARETDARKRIAEYESLQRDSQARSPFAIMLQSQETAALRKVVTGFEIAPLSGRNVFYTASKTA